VKALPDDRAPLGRKLVFAQGLDALFPVPPVELVEVEVRRLQSIEAPDVDIDSIRVAPRTVERVNPTAAAEVVLCDVGTERVRRQRFAAAKKLEVRFIYDQMKIALLAAGTAIAADTLEFLHGHTVPNRAAMATSLDELRRSFYRHSNGSPDLPPSDTLCS
jgi:hypothetical protein